MRKFFLHKKFLTQTKSANRSHSIMLSRRTIFIGWALLHAHISLGTQFQGFGILPHNSRPKRSKKLETPRPDPRNPLCRPTEPPETISVPCVPETWIDQLSEEEVQAIDRVFPYLGFGLACYIARSGKTSVQEIFGDSLTDFNPQSGSCRNMKKGKFQGRFYILKSKEDMGALGRHPGESYRRARVEAGAGARIRQAFVDAFSGNGRDPDRMSEEFGCLICLVAPIDCGDHIASLEVPNATSLHDIVYAERRPFSPVVKQSSDGIPKPDFGSDDAPLRSRKELFPDMDFGQAKERIDAFGSVIEAVKFLHANGVAHNDIHSGNLLFPGNNYTRMCLIDFDRSVSEQQRSQEDDRQFLIYAAEGYFFGATHQFSPTEIDVSCINDPETFSYELEELGKIRKMLCDLQ
jgi:hypothetical protein